MEKVFEMHAHYTMKMSLEETISIFREEFEATGTEKCNFLSMPHHGTPEGELLYAEDQNVKGLFLKRAFSPNAYAYAGLIHPLDVASRDDKELSKSYLVQAETYARVGFDGMKMLEGYPSMRKAMKRRLDDPVYDNYYSFLEENRIPVTMHVANPENYWDVNQADEFAIKAGRVCDATFPTKAALHEEVEGIMKKHPRLRLALAHFGFMSYDINQARRWLDDYENTIFDLTPGGEQLLTMRKDWEKWHAFFVQYQDRIIYGTDFYAWKKGPNWEIGVQRRPRFVRQFFETDSEHEYGKNKFVGVKLEKEIRDKIYFKNAVREMGLPKPIDEAWLRLEAERVLRMPNKNEEFADVDMRYILNDL